MTKLDFMAEFREEHRKVRDSLLDIIEAFGAKDVAKAREILGEINTAAGPHCRFEEDAFYPALRVFLGEHMERFFEEHDGVIETAKACAELLGKDSLTDEEAKGAADAARKLLLHVTNCDGLAILAERLDSSEMDRLADKFAEVREEGVSLLEWDDCVRQREARRS